MSTGLYAYAITRGLTEADVTDQRGIGGAPVRVVEREGLVVLVSEVDLDDFGEEGLRRNLEDLAWLESVAVAHDEVARFAASRVPTAPLRLATVFLTDDSVRAQLAEWHSEAVHALDRIEGRTEWSVKAYADPAAARPAPEPTESDSSGAGAGKAYLLQRRAATQRREQAAEEDGRFAERIHATLDGLATMSRRLAPQDKRLSGYDGVMILNGTYLLDDAQVPAFRDAVAELDQQQAHVRVEYGGPWPPYSFATLDAS